MSQESFHADLPEEINITSELQVGEDGSSFLYEKDGVKYGGDYLPETPEVISLDSETELPSPPNEEEPIVI